MPCFLLAIFLPTAREPQHLVIAVVPETRVVFIYRLEIVQYRAHERSLRVPKAMGQLVDFRKRAIDSCGQR